MLLRIFVESEKSATRAVSLSGGRQERYWGAIRIACRGLAAVAGKQVSTNAEETIKPQADSCCQGLLEHPKATSTGLAVCAIALLSPDEDLPPFADGAHKIATRAVELSGGSEPLPLRSLALAFDATGNRKRAIKLMREALAVASNDPVEKRKITGRLDEWADGKRAIPTD
ncbi:MAG: hypothetical protein WBE26_11650 [Phycisphaerae bacterium]